MELANPTTTKGTTTMDTPKYQALDQARLFGVKVQILGRFRQTGTPWDSSETWVYEVKILDLSGPLNQQVLNDVPEALLTVDDYCCTGLAR